MAAEELQTRSLEASGWVSRSFFVHSLYAFSPLLMIDLKFDDEAAVAREDE